MITENLVVERRFHANFTISNTHLGENDYSVTIGCSPVSEGGSCTGSGKRAADQGCRESYRRAGCIPDEDGADCWDEWTETYTTPSTATTCYFCSTSSFVPTCYSCGGQGLAVFARAGHRPPSLRTVPVPLRGRKLFNGVHPYTEVRNET